jgi:hypothetical protein
MVQGSEESPTYGNRLWQSTSTGLHLGRQPSRAEDAIDQLDEVRDVALLRCAKYQQALRCYHERNVRPREFHAGDLVLRRVQGSKDRHKLSPPWEGPFIIHEVLRLGTYKIRCEDGRVISNAWNIEHLHPFILVIVRTSYINK